MDNMKTYRYRNKTNFLLDGKCFTNEIVYSAEVKTDNAILEQPTNICFGISGTENGQYLNDLFGTVMF